MGRAPAHVHHMRVPVVDVNTCTKKRRMAAVKRAGKSDLETVFKKVNTSIVGRKSSAPQCHVPALLVEYEFPPLHVHRSGPVR